MDPLNITRHADFEGTDKITSLPHDVINHILSYLDFQYLINFECFSNSSKDLKNFKLNHSWTILKIKDNLNFSWEICQKESNPPKWEYRLSRALSRYIFFHKYQEINRPINQADCLELFRKIGEQYRDLTEKFPILNKYLGVDSRGLAELTLSEKDLNDFNFCLTGWSGEKFLGGLIATTFSKDETIIEKLFLDSIGKASTCASVFSVSLPLLDEIRNTIALKAAEHGDERALQIMLEEYEIRLPYDKYFANNLYNSGNRFYSLCKYLGDKSLTDKQYENAEEYYTSLMLIQNPNEVILFDLGRDPHEMILFKAGYVKMSLKKYEESDELLTRALELYGEYAPSNVLNYAGRVKLCVDKFSDADILLTKALKLYGEDAPYDLLVAAGNAKICNAGKKDTKTFFEKYREAQDLFERALKVWNHPTLLKNLDGVKSALNKYESLECDTREAQTSVSCIIM